MHWKRKILIFREDNVHHLEAEDGLLEAWERKILIFLWENNCFCEGGRSWRTDSSAGKAENIEFPAGNCAFLETEEGLLEAWERKILISPQ